MSSKREEERNEKVIRGLMKLPPNRRCINCNSLGPQYVCTNFWTFVCMTCSGIHREFTHRVKSVSMAKFTSQEVDSLQKGGNQRARELYLTIWDPQRDRLPDNSNADKVRDFIKNVYVNRKYSMDNSTEKPPRDPQGLRNYEDEKRRASSYHSYSQSPPYDFEYEERRYGKQTPTLTRKPGSDRGIEGKLSSFLSPSHANDERFTKRTASSGSFGSFDSNSMSFKSVNSSESERHVISHDKSSPGTFGGLDHFDAPFAPQNVTSTPPTLNNSQLPVPSFTQPVKTFQQSTFTEQQPSQIQQPSLFDLFSSPTQQQSDASSTEKKSDEVMPNEGGWATFDMAQNSVLVTPDNSALAAVLAPDQNISGKFNPFSIDQSSSYSVSNETTAPSNSFWHEGPQNVEIAKSAAPNWSSFQEKQHNVPNVIHNDEQAIEFYDSSADRSLGFAALEGLYNDGNVRGPVVSETPSSGLTSYINTAPKDLSMVSTMAGAGDFTANHNPSNFNHNPTNPFDLPFESDMSSGNVYWDMSSLQAALPTNTQNQPAPYVGDSNQSWFSQNPIQSYIPGGVTFDHPTGSLGLISGQIPNSNLVTTIPTQGPVASVGGNPFA